MCYLIHCACDAALNRILIAPVPHPTSAYDNRLDDEAASVRRETELALQVKDTSSEPGRRQRKLVMLQRVWQFVCE